MGADIYRKLQQHLDNFPVPYPASPSGVEVSILKRLFTPQEAEIALALNLLPERAEKIHSRLPALQMPLEELRSLLEAMTMKGLVNGGIKKSKGKNVPTYGKAPLVVGMFEWQVNRLTRDLVEDFHTYVDESFGDALFTKKTSQMRTVPINTRIASRGQIGRYDDIRNFINNSRGPFAVMNCICRQARELTGHYCSSSESHETCLTIGEGAVWMRRLRRARLITRADCLEVLDRAEAQGLVLQPQNSQSPQFICCCCPDCCEILINARKLPRPADYVDSNYRALVNRETCTGCKICEKRCPMNAVSVAEKKAAVDPDRCIGCGVCAVACKEQAIRLSPKPKQTVPPRSANALYQKMMIERYGPLRTLGRAAKLIMGGKV